MSALVSYSSSDEEDKGELPVQLTGANAHKPSLESIGSNITSIEVPDKQSSDQSQHSTIGLPILSAPLLGPTLCPGIETEYKLPEDQDFNTLSPYSKNRAMLRNLTLPAQPNYDIPPPPLASPTKKTEAKFNHFLELKNRGIHFNQKLAKSTALKNPSLMQKLMDFAEIDETGQYLTSLSKAHWDPGAFPNYAYKEELSKIQLKIHNKRNDEKTRGQRESIEFIQGALSADLGTSGIQPKSTQKNTLISDRGTVGLNEDVSGSSKTRRTTRFGT